MSTISTPDCGCVSWMGSKAAGVHASQLSRCLADDGGQHVVMAVSRDVPFRSGRQHLQRRREGATMLTSVTDPGEGGLPEGRP